MPRVTHVTTNFTAGEISPRLLGRTDIARYQNAAKQITNGWPVIHGGVVRRHGTKYVAETKDSTKATRLIPFVFNLEQTYVLEFGDQYVRFYKDAAQVMSGMAAYELATPYTEAMLPEICWAQAADTMFITHHDVHPKRLRRFADNLWDLGDIPFDPMPFDEIGETPATTCTLSASSVGSARTFTAGAAVFLASDVGRQITSGAGIADITSITSATIAVGDITTAFPSTSLASGDWTITGTPQTACTPSATGTVGLNINLTLAAAGWRTTDVGKFVEINGGLVQLAAYTSPTIFSATVLRVLENATAAQADAWILSDSAWSASLGYPRAVTLYQQRLILAGSTSYPGYVWGSATGLPFDFTLGLNSDDAFAFEIASGEVNPIMQLSSRDALIVQTTRAEYTMQGGVELPLSPTNVQLKQRSTYGTDTIRPIAVREETLFVQRAGRKLRALKYDVENGGYIAPDIAVLAEHITEGGIVETAYQQEYDPLIWCVRGDGAMVTCTFDRDQEVVGWAKQTTDGLFESVCVIPIDGRDQVWVVVNRTINGSAVRYVEVFDPDILLDCAIVGTSGPGAAIWAGLDALEGETVQCVADGVYMGEFVVAGGEITLPRNANDVVIGLPYTTTVVTLTPEMQGMQSFQGGQISAHEIFARFLDTYSSYLSGDEVAFRQFGGSLLDQPPQAFTGIKRVSNLGWESGTNEVPIAQPEPLPWHLLSIIRKITVNS